MNGLKLYIFLLCFSLAGYAWLAWNLIGRDLGQPVPEVCLFREVTHLPCPSCGTTRSMILLAEGDIAGAFMVNPLGIFLAAAMILVPVWIVLDILSKKRSFLRFYFSAETVLVKKMWILIPAILLFMVNWFWNIAKGL
jgi:hypothetical protein